MPFDSLRSLRAVSNAKCASGLGNPPSVNRPTQAKIRLEWATRPACVRTAPQRRHRFWWRSVPRCSSRFEFPLVCGFAIVGFAAVVRIARPRRQCAQAGRLRKPHKQRALNSARSPSGKRKSNPNPAASGDRFLQAKLKDSRHLAEGSVTATA